MDSKPSIISRGTSPIRNTVSRGTSPIPDLFEGLIANNSDGNVYVPKYIPTPKCLISGKKDENSPPKKKRKIIFVSPHHERGKGRKNFNLRLPVQK